MVIAQSEMRLQADFGFLKQISYSKLQISKLSIIWKENLENYSIAIVFVSNYSLAGRYKMKYSIISIKLSSRKLKWTLLFVLTLWIYLKISWW